MATIINAANQFKNIFSTNGYFLIMPDLLRIYSNNQVFLNNLKYNIFENLNIRYCFTFFSALNFLFQTNELITRTIEYLCKQLYILHRKPFLLQMFGSVAPILDKDDDESPYGDAFKVRRILNSKMFEKIIINRHLKY